MGGGGGGLITIDKGLKLCHRKRITALVWDHALFLNVNGEGGNLQWQRPQPMSQEAT